ncbi:MAG: hypothetical protein IPG10_14590 [Flavobacteriales bacterium]|nr:hypothetical protein [Flavobacteriales bacterium]MBK6755863.1 hypothetical protein [Flavobacteriales bacterium]MBK7270525.1 hypothetical protein [Flavobacteriales bacterium]MBK7751535.1 hypothetical protein [Flavobacteriales bacterium]MBK9073874.1 hypothetical protein [Flavobacteriales bacterium]
MRALLPALAWLPVHAQESDDSPYSAYGFGDLLNANQVVQATMGGTGVATADAFSVSSIQPASYAGLGKTTFEFGGVGRWVELSSSSQEQARQAARILGFSIGVPFGKGKYGLALGLTPLSDVGYLITDQNALPDGQAIDYRYEGSGGLNKAFFGVGGVLWQRRDSLGNGHRLTGGANFNYLFGGIERTRKAEYPGGQNFLNTQAFSSLILRGPLGTLGIQYFGDVRERSDPDDDPLRYVLGAFLEPAMRISARLDELTSTYTLGSSGVQFPRDTVTISEGVRGNVTIPMAWGIGVGLTSPVWNVSMEVKRRDWTRLVVDVEGYGLPSEVRAGTTYALGANWTPLGSRNGSFLGRTIYRIGARHTRDYLVVKDQQLAETGVSAGFSFPLLNSMTRSRFNIGAELGQRGTTANGALQERFVDVFVGITITPELRENWFRKRRID